MTRRENSRDGGRETVMLWRGCPLGAGPASRARRPAAKVEFARLLKDQGHTLGEIAARPASRRPHCIATSPPSLPLNDPNSRERLGREVTTMKKVCSPRVAGITDWDEPSLPGQGLAAHDSRRTVPVAPAACVSRS